MSGQQFHDVLAMTTIGAKGPANATRIAADGGGGLRMSIKGAPYGTINVTQPVNAPVPPGNPLFWFDAQDIDQLGNSSSARPIVIIATDNVTAASHTWVFTNGNFTPADVGKILNVSGATNAANNASFQILTVTGPTTITTTGTQTNETFATPGNLLASVTGTGAGLQDGSVVNAWLNKGAFLTAGVQVHAIRSAGNLVFRKQWGSGRAANLSSIHSDGTGFMATAAIAALTLPCTIAVVFSLDALAPSGNHYALCDGLGAGRAGFYVDSATGAVHMTGAGDFPTPLTVGANQLNALVGSFNTGATAFVNLNGTATSALGTCTPAAMTGVTLFSLITNTFPMTGDLFEYLVWTDSTTIAQAQNYLAAKFGSMPQ